jgi:8-oxo-dGTP pyrophosphatase MutT (NUDIX family)
MSDTVIDTTDIVTIIVRDNSGRFYAHQRNSDKKVFPGMYGLGAGGHVRKDEKSTEAAKRELQEETGIETEPTYLFSFPFTSSEGTHNTYVHEVTTDKPVRPDKYEWQWSGWLDEKAINRLVDEGKLMPDTAIIYRRYLTDHAKPAKT